MKSTMFIEEWRDIKGYEGLYQVSNLGKVRSLDRYVNYNDGTIHLHKGRMLDPIEIKDKYLGVCLSKNNKRNIRSIHRLVMKTFLPNPDNLPQVNHINTCKWDNAIWNLEWCDAKKNNNNPFTIAKRINGKLSRKINQYTLDGELVKTWCSMAEIKRTLNYEPSAICLCCKNRKKTYKGFKWQYTDY